MSTENHSAFADYQKQQIANTLARIDEAIVYLREKQLPISKVSVANEACLSLRVMHKPHVREHLSQYPEFNPTLTEAQLSDNDIRKYEEKISNLNAKLKKAQEHKKLLAENNAELKKELEDLNQKYQRLLGKYQVQFGEKIVPF